MADAEDKDVQAFNELQKKLIENAENQKAVSGPHVLDLGQSWTGIPKP